jgi:hypothetical protein
MRKFNSAAGIRAYSVGLSHRNECLFFGLLGALAAIWLAAWVVTGNHMLHVAAHQDAQGDGRPALATCVPADKSVAGSLFVCQEPANRSHHDI